MTQEEIEKKYPIKMDSVEPGYRITKLQVMKSAAGYYIGRAGYKDFQEPYTRESDYYATAEEAEKELRTGFEVRQCVENEYGYENGTIPKPPLINMDPKP